MIWVTNLVKCVDQHFSVWSALVITFVFLIFLGELLEKTVLWVGELLEAVLGGWANY